jgi:hypothetical protein
MRMIAGPRRRNWRPRIKRREFFQRQKFEHFLISLCWLALADVARINRFVRLFDTSRPTSIIDLGPCMDSRYEAEADKERSPHKIIAKWPMMA